MRMIFLLICLACFVAVLIAGCATPIHQDTTQLQWIH
jgi:hypothetical protein